MFDSFTRWFGRTPMPGSWQAIEAWANDNGLSFRVERDRQGFVVEGPLDPPEPEGPPTLGRSAAPARSTPPDAEGAAGVEDEKPDAVGPRWRMEWGPPQRSYLGGPELRVRCELGLPHDLQMLLISSSLMEALERDAFGRYTQQAQTEIELDVPEEMRWLAMFRKVDLSAWRGLRHRLGAVAHLPGSVEAWLDDPRFVARLQSALDGTVQAEGEHPWVLMTLRGRLYLRTRLEQPSVDMLEEVRPLFVRAGRRLRDLPQILQAREAGRGGATADPFDG